MPHKLYLVLQRLPEKSPLSRSLLLKQESDLCVLIGHSALTVAYVQEEGIRWGPEYD